MKFKLLLLVLLFPLYSFAVFTGEEYLSEETGLAEGLVKVETFVYKSGPLVYQTDTLYYEDGKLSKKAFEHEKAPIFALNCFSEGENIFSHNFEGNDFSFYSIKNYMRDFDTWITFKKDDKNIFFGQTFFDGNFNNFLKIEDTDKYQELRPESCIIYKVVIN